MLKTLQARLQQYVNCELPYVQAGFRKGRGTRDQMANILWIIEKAREFQKNIYFCFTDYAKPLCVAAAAVKSVQSCPTLCNPIDSSPPDSPGKNTGAGCHFLFQCIKVKSESEVAQSCRLFATPWTVAYQTPLSMGFSR